MIMVFIVFIGGDKCPTSPDAMLCASCVLITCCMFQYCDVSR
jgi:hypothetical protein